MEEREYKFLVGLELFTRKQQEFRNLYPECTGNEKLQINYYYDTALETLRDGHMTVRVRQTEDRLVLQTKFKRTEITGFQQSKETEQPIDFLPEKIISKSSGEEYLFQGALTTKRTQYRPAEGISLEFDCNYYLGVCDHEIELEFDECATQEAVRLVKELFEELPHNKKGKASRFFKRKRHLKKNTFLP